MTERNLTTTELNQIAEKIFDFKMMRDGKEVNVDFIS